MDDTKKRTRTAMSLRGVPRERRAMESLRRFAEHDVQSRPTAASVFAVGLDDDPVRSAPATPRGEREAVPRGGSFEQVDHATIFPESHVVPQQEGHRRAVSQQVSSGSFRRIPAGAVSPFEEGVVLSDGSLSRRGLITAEDLALWSDIQSIRGADTVSVSSEKTYLGVASPTPKTPRTPREVLFSAKLKVEDRTVGWFSRWVDSIYTVLLIRYLLSFKPLRKAFHLVELVINSFSQARREFHQRKINFLLGFLSCFVLVTTVLVMMTALQKIPVVYLRMVEEQEGEQDLVFKSESWLKRPFLNHSLLLETQSSGEFSYHTPRFEFSPGIYAERFCSNWTGLMDAAESWYHNSSDSSCSNYSPLSASGCLAKSCSGFVEASVVLIDTNRERVVELGRKYDLRELGPGECHLHSSLAQALRVTDGADILVTADLSSTFQTVHSGWMVNFDANWDDLQSAANGTLPALPSWVSVSKRYVVMKMRVVSVFGSPMGKVGEDKENYMIAEYSPFMEHLAASLDPFLHDTTLVNTSATRIFLEDVENHNLRETASKIILNLPPRRFESYMSTDFEKIQRTVVSFASRASYLIGYGAVDADLPILDGLYITQFLSLFLGLIVNIVILMLSILCMLLVYSLLLSSLETRVWELGVMRMIGMSRLQMLLMLCIQAETYGVPATISGVGIGILLSWLISYLFGGSTGLPVTATPDTTGLILSISLGLLVPLLSGLLPIRSALKRNLQESMSAGHQAKGVVIKVKTAADKQREASLLRFAIGGFTFLFGFLIYYFFPLALLLGKLSWLANIFFMLIVGMLLGMVLLTLNVQFLLQKLLVKVFFFWETRAIRHLIVKNLISHRSRNQKTTIMYSVSIGIIIFGMVSYQSQLYSFVYREQQQEGAMITVKGTDSPLSKMKELEEAAFESDYVDNVGWVSKTLADALNIEWSWVNNIGQLESLKTWIRGVSPQLFASAISGFLKMNEIRAKGGDEFFVSEQLKKKNLGEYCLEQLYTPYGRHSILLGTAYKDLLSLEEIEDAVDLSWQWDTTPLETIVHTKANVLGFIHAAPGLRFSQFPSQTSQDAVVSLPHFVTLLENNGSGVLDIPYYKMMIDLPPGAPKSEGERLIARFEAILEGIGGVSVWDFYSVEGPLGTASTIVTGFFAFATLLALFVCFFSLSSSMQTNILEQTTELGIMRSLGVTRWMILRLYIWESITLVMSACITGICLGTLVSWTMTFQNRLFTELPIPLFFPWEITLMVLAVSLVLATLGAVVPGIVIMRKSIVQIGRMQH